MKRKLISIPSLLIILCIAGCARNDVNNNDIAYRNQNKTAPNRITDNISNRNRQDIRNDNRIVNNKNINNNSRMRVANQAAKKVSEMNEVDTANIIVTNNNAYAAVKLASGKSLTNKVENEISKRVRSVDQNIDRVYISANPDFYNHMRGYADDIRAGKPITGLFSKFSNTISRIFPDAK